MTSRDDGEITVRPVAILDAVAANGSSSPSSAATTSPIDAKRSSRSFSSARMSVVFACGGISSKPSSDGGLAIEDLREQRDGAVVHPPRRLSGQQLVPHHGPRELIGPPVERIAPQLLEARCTAACRR